MNPQRGWIRKPLAIVVALLAGLFLVNHFLFQRPGGGEPPPHTVRDENGFTHVAWPAQPGHRPALPALDLALGPHEIHLWWSPGGVKERMGMQIEQAVMVPTLDAVAAGVPGPAACKESAEAFGGCHFGLAKLYVQRKIEAPARYAVLTGRKPYDAREPLGVDEAFSTDLRWFRVRRGADGREDFVEWLCPPPHSSNAKADNKLFPPHPQVLDCRPMARRAAWRDWLGIGRAGRDERAVLFDCREAFCRAHFVFAGRPVLLEFSHAFGPEPGRVRLHLFQAAWQTLNRQRAGVPPDEKGEAALHLKACEHSANAAPIDSRWNTLSSSGERAWQTLSLSCRRAASTAQRLAAAQPQETVRILTAVTRAYAVAGVRPPPDLLATRLDLAERIGGRGSEAHLEALADVVRYHPQMTPHQPGYPAYEQRLLQAWTLARQLRLPPGDGRRLVLYDRLAQHWQEAEKPEELQRLHDQQLADAEAIGGAQSVLLVRPLTGVLQAMTWQKHEALLRSVRERLTQVWLHNADPRALAVGAPSARPDIDAAAIALVRSYSAEANRSARPEPLIAAITRIRERMAQLHPARDAAMQDLERAWQGLPPR